MLQCGQRRIENSRGLCKNAVMPRVFTLLLLLVVSGQTLAERLWVVGSYRNRANADAQQARVAGMLATETLIIRYETGNTWRVAVLAREISGQQLADAAIEAWLVDLELGASDEPAVFVDTTPTAEPAAEPMSPAPDRQSSPAAVKPSSVPDDVVIPAPATAGATESKPAVDESWIDFCLRGRTSEMAPRECESNEMILLLERHRQLERSTDTLVSVCDVASTDLEARICRTWESGGDLNSGSLREN